MRIHVVSDVHGRADALASAADGADALICLGDLILFIDYHDHAQGIFAELFGQENADRFIALRTQKRFDEAREFSRSLWSSLGGDAWPHIERAVDRQYAELFAAMPAPAYLTYGNVDIPRMWGPHLRDGHRVLDGETTEIGGLRFGFVGGGLRTEYRTPYELDDDDYAAKVEALGEVDVLCAHIRRTSPSCCTTRWRAASSGGAGRSWRRSTGRSPGTSSSGTSTSRWRAGCASAAPSA